jgi:hypothetical protein
MGSTSELVDSGVASPLEVKPVGVGMIGSMVDELLMTGAEYTGLL